MEHHLLVELATVLLLGAAAQWLAWRMHWPAIVLLLAFGFLAGPVAGLIHPDKLLGDLLQPVVAISVAIILFEGGMTLRLREMDRSGVVARLLSLGVAVTWLLAGVGAHLLLGFPAELAVLLGAILLVTGPTVVMPLLRHARLKKPVAQTLKWEGILIDPIGAIAAVLVFEAIRGDQAAMFAGMGWGLLRAAAGGTLAGLLGAALLLPLLRRYWIPDYLESPATLALVVGVFAAADWYQAESGLLAVTLMGAILANQRWAHVRHIARFKENLSVLLLSVLFILLAARIEPAALRQIGWMSLAFAGWLIAVVRPASVAVSTLGSGLGWRERVYLAAIAPRGIVAAAVASAFALGLPAAAHGQAGQLLPVTFIVIVATAGVSSVIARPLARLLNLAESRRDGYLILGAHPAARRIGHAMREAELPVLLLDQNRTAVRKARMEGLPAHRGNIVSDDIVDEPPLEGIGRLLALSASDEANSLAVMRFGEVFDRSGLYQLAPEDPEAGQETGAPAASRARYLFGEGVTYTRLLKAVYRGAEIKSTPLTEQFGYEEYLAHHSGEVLPLFCVDESGEVTPITAEREFEPKAGYRIIGLVEPGDTASSRDR